MVKKSRTVIFGALIFLLAGNGWAQQKPEEVPDAPSASRPIPPPALPPSTPPASQAPGPDSSSADTPAPQPQPKSEPVPANAPPRSAPDDADQKTSPPPMPPVKTVPEGTVAVDSENPREDLYKIGVTVNYVVVPVTVKDGEGRLVSGLRPKDFSVLENGKKQTLNYFTSDPFPLSVAVVFDLGMSDSGVRKIQETLPALQGAFSQFDEVAIYTY